MHQKGNLKYFTDMKCVHLFQTLYQTSGMDQGGVQCNTERFMIVKGFVWDLLNLKIKKMTYFHFSHKTIS